MFGEKTLGDGTFHVHRLVSGVALTEVCYSAYVKTSRVCGTASRAGVRGTDVRGDGPFWVDGTLHVHRRRQEPSLLACNICGRIADN